MFTIHEFYVRFLRQLTLPPALPESSFEWFYTYFDERGISQEMIAEAGIIPLTMIPDQTEKDAYKACMHEKRVFFPVKKFLFTNQQRGGPVFIFRFTAAVYTPREMDKLLHSEKHTIRKHTDEIHFNIHLEFA